MVYGRISSGVLPARTFLLIDYSVIHQQRLEVLRNQTRAVSRETDSYTHTPLRMPFSSPLGFPAAIYLVNRLARYLEKPSIGLRGHPV